MALLFPKSQNNCNNATPDINKLMEPRPAAPNLCETKITVNKPSPAINVLLTKFENIPLLSESKFYGLDVIGFITF